MNTFPLNGAPLNATWVKTRAASSSGALRFYYSPAWLLALLPSLFLES